jgi:hypothetical protein
LTDSAKVVKVKLVILRKYNDRGELKVVKRLSLCLGAFLLGLGLFISPKGASAHDMEDNWANNDTIGYGYETDGGYVLAIQRMLKDTPWGYSAVDGYWGSKTYNGVVNFQRNEGIAADGIIGPVTWEEFEDYRVYVGYLGSTQYYEWNYNLTDSYPATYLRNACYGWYIDVTTNNSEDYWHVDHDFERLTYMCL